MTPDEPNSPMNQTNQTSDDEVNLLDYWRVIWRGKMLIILIVVVSIFTTAFISLLMPNIYQATAVITPVNPSVGGSSTLAQQFASLPGISLQAPPLSSEIVNLLKSNILREKMIEKYDLLPVLFYKQWDEEKKIWKKEKRGTNLNPAFLMQKLFKKIVPENPKDIKNPEDSPEIWDGLRMLNKIVEVKNTLKENTITISVNFREPEMAAKMVNYFLATLNDHMTSEAKRVAKTNMKYLEEQVEKTADPFIKQKIYSLIAEQIETSMMAEVKENFAFKVLDPPKEPDRKIKPKRAQMVILSFVVSLFLGIFAVFSREYLKNARQRLRREGIG
jgi:uncharacterized protein involved in exopolysaccharide biosynthesis